MTVFEFQHLIEKIYYEKDNERGAERTFLWFVEEIGELAAAIRGKDGREVKAELSDVFVWLVGLANLLNIDLEEVASIYENGCPGCRKLPCQCSEPE
ncbi:nucleotide pyrophosphohydrolase [candidate division NPL-UPA2 bacterium]|nr:nucleotide pyrophosphohydrolase [candidate division NPL-UPA2 bacterium]